MKQIILLGGFLFLYVWPALAQNSYTFSQTTDTYAELTGDVAISPAHFGSGDIFLLDELNGETFYFFKQAYTFGGSNAFYIENNGNIRIDNDSQVIIFDGAFAFLDSIDNTSKLSIKIEGGSGSKIVKCQWKNLKFRSGKADNYMNLQIWVYQATGVVEYHYGPSSASNASGFNTSNGPQAGAFMSDDQFTKVYEKLWLFNVPSNLGMDSSKTFSFSALKGLPPEGALYRFTPRFATMGIWLTEKRQLQFYPNPAAEGIIYFNEPVTAVVTDINGRIVSKLEQQSEADLSNFPAGIYLLQCDDGRKAKLVK